MLCRKALSQSSAVKLCRRALSSLSMEAVEGADGWRKLTVEALRQRTNTRLLFPG